MTKGEIKIDSAVKDLEYSYLCKIFPNKDYSTLEIISFKYSPLILSRRPFRETVRLDVVSRWEEIQRIETIYRLEKSRWIELYRQLR